jgi:hypothetical protein
VFESVDASFPFDCLTLDAVDVPRSSSLAPSLPVCLSRLPVARGFSSSVVSEKSALLPWYPVVVAAEHPVHFYGSPQIVLLFFDCYNHLVKMPFVCYIRTLASHLIRVLLPELLTPIPNYFIGHLNAAIQHHFLNVPVAQRKGVIQPNTVTDNFAQKSMTGIHEQEVAIKVGPVRLFYSPVYLTMPDCRIIALRNYGCSSNKSTRTNRKQIRCICFVPYAPEQNPIEDIWLQAKTYLRQCYYRCETFAQVKQLFVKFLQDTMFDFPKLYRYG